MAKLEQIQARIKKLEAQAEALTRATSAHVIKQIHDLMQKHGLTMADIAAYLGPGRKGRPGRVAAAGRSAGTAKSTIKGKLPPKYRDPKTGATWSGHARPPAWIKDVKDRSKFLIDGADTSSVKAEAKPAARKAAAKTSAAKKTAAKKAARKAAKKAVATKRVAPKSGTPARRGRPPAKKAAAKRVIGRKTAAKSAEAVPTPSSTPEAATATA